MSRVSIWLVLLLSSLTEATIQPMVVLKQIRQQVQARQDLIINGVVGGVLFSASDVLAQRIEQCKTPAVGKRKRDEEKTGIMQQLLATDKDFYRTVDWKRCSSAGILGCFLSSGLYPAAYEKIDLIWKNKDVSLLLFAILFRFISIIADVFKSFFYSWSV
mmetsp:Transcript_39954/g.96413  ORF Transcript_39954/g.96413 Transcript_39954/m.96413 type:complete len:160 (+) Transcript_39954:134-613(+)